MPADGLLQRFHDLAEADEEVRCRAAVGVRMDLTQRSGDNNEDLQYTFRRLVRGVQSSRACCRQGFSLALSEVLVAFPHELINVLDLIRQHTELQPGLKNSELKDRLLGRLFAYAAVLQAGCLKPGISSSKGKRPARGGGLAELGKGLHEIFAMRPYLKAPAARILADAVAELVAGGLSEMVPELLGPWSIEEKAAALTGTGTVDVHTAGLLLELRALYVQAEQAGASKDALKSFPACIRKELLAKPASAEGLVLAVGNDLAAAPLSDGLSWVVGPFCSWLLEVSQQKGCAALQDQVWPTLHSALFPEKSTPAAEAQGLRALAEIASQLRDAGLAGAANGSVSSSAAALLSGLFKRMPRGLTLLFRALSWQKALSHPAALFAQKRLVEALGVTSPPPHTGGKRKAHAVAEETSSQPLPMTDETRLDILGAVQSQKTFGTMNGKFQRMWQQALLAPLSPAGVRARCTTLLAGLAHEGESADPNGRRVYADQLVQLATHSHAPDEVILAALCLLLTQSYFEPVAGAETCATFSLNKFRSSAGLHTSSSEDDLILSTLSCGAKPNGQSAEDGQSDASVSQRTQWRLKLWQSLVGMSRHMSPEQAAKFAATTRTDGNAEDAQPSADPVARTFAFHGCLVDGSLWVMRLHEWWDYITSDAEGQAPSKKKRKNQSGSVGGSATMRCTVPLKSDDMSLRKRCLERCRAILSEPEGEASLPARQRNALCGLPLVLALTLLEEEDNEKDTDEPAVQEHLQDVVAILEEFPLAPSFPDSPKQKAKALAAFRLQRAEVLAQVPRIAAELFVESNRLIKEAARTAWRELSEYTSDETLTSLCASVRDVDGDEEDKEDKANGDESDGEGSDEGSDAEGEEVVSAATAAKIARLQNATAKLKAERDAEKASKPAGGGEEDEDEEDEILLTGDAVLEQLLDEGGDDAGGGFLNSLAAGLNGDDASGPKAPKWQQRLQHRQDDLTRKFREVELLELFTQKCADKRPITVQLLQEIFDALLAAGRRAMGNNKKDSGEEGSAAPKKRTKANAMLQRMEKELVQRLGGVLSKVLKHVCRGPALLAASQWHTSSEWATRAKALATMGSSPQNSGAGQRPAEVGAVLFYWLCSLHRVRTAADAGAEPGAWTLASELLAVALQDWCSKKGCDKWCQALLGAFAVRVPEAVLQLPWGEQVRNSRNLFVQREQVAFVTNSLLRGLAPDTKGAAEFSADFAALCAELLEGTLQSATAVEGEQTAGGGSGSQKQKMRREVLRCLAVLLRTRNKKDKFKHTLPEVACRQVAKAVTKVRDALPARRGEVFQLCLHVLRALNGPKGEKDSGRKSPPGSPKAALPGSPKAALPGSPKAALREAPEEVVAGATKKSAKRAKTSQPEKGSKGFFGEM